jgi:hypothetical protein
VGGIPWLCQCLCRDLTGRAQGPKGNLSKLRALHSPILGSLRLYSGEAERVLATIRHAEVAEEAVATTVIWQR